MSEEENTQEEVFESIDDESTPDVEEVQINETTEFADWWDTVGAKMVSDGHSPASIMKAACVAANNGCGLSEVFEQFEIDMKDDVSTLASTAFHCTSN